MEVEGGSGFRRSKQFETIIQVGFQSSVGTPALHVTVHFRVKDGNISATHSSMIEYRSHLNPIARYRVVKNFQVMLPIGTYAYFGQCPFNLLAMEVYVE